MSVTGSDFSVKSDEMWLGFALAEFEFFMECFYIVVMVFLT